MPYRICKTFEIENGHVLSKHPDECRFLHGHSRRVEIILEAEELDANDMVCDFKAIREAVLGYLRSLDHAMCVNTDDPNFASLKEKYGERIIPFTGHDPTTEVMARAIFDQTKQHLDRYRNESGARYPVTASVRLLRVRVSETASTWAEYYER